MKRLTIRHIQKMKDDGDPIVMLTAYDAASARVGEAADVPMLLVGDSLGMVIQGYDSTIPVTMAHMIYHCEIVSRVTQRPLVVGDLPFMSYSVSEAQAMENAARLMQDGGVGAVKLEGGENMAATIERIVAAGIPVMGHIGLTPQSVNQFGGFRVQGRQLESARKLIQDARAVEAAGAFSIVLELVPASLAELITDILQIPTIGIGAGGGCDGQVQVFHDILAMFDADAHKHTRQYVQLWEQMRDAIQQYRDDVQARRFPTADNSFSISEEIMDTLRDEVQR